MRRIQNEPDLPNKDLRRELKPHMKDWATLDATFLRNFKIRATCHNIRRNGQDLTMDEANDLLSTKPLSAAEEVLPMDNPFIKKNFQDMLTANF